MRASSVEPAAGGGAIRVGVSSCLLGCEVRWDGGHKRDGYVTGSLSEQFQWVPVCPEVEMGLGTPRDALRLVGDLASPRMLFRATGEDITARMQAWAGKRLEQLAREDLSGYVLKSDSPSCGMERVKVFTAKAPPAKKGVGLFARALIDRFPLLPVEEEGRLNDDGIRENFIERVFCYHRWKQAQTPRLTPRRLVSFHTVHKYLIMAHSPRHVTELGGMVARADRAEREGLADAYGRLFMSALAVRATRSKHANVLQHLLGYLKRDLEADHKAELLALIDDYRRGLVPLVVPVTLLRHHIARTNDDTLKRQVYLDPHPKELMLRNHV